jgi:hypothetical protein
MPIKKLPYLLAGLSLAVIVLAGCGSLTAAPTHEAPSIPPTQTSLLAPTESQPAAPTAAPLVVPDGFQEIAALSGAGMPVMLPAEFSTEEGLPPIQPYVYTADPDEYEASLDYGAECQGAGACHYGSLAAKRVESATPVSTTNFEFDAARAQKITLNKGIEGYFVEALCGATCDDAKVFWIYNGVQYMVGLKGAGQAAVVELANAALDNSLP